MSEHDRLASALETGDLANVREIVSNHPGIVNAPEWTPPPLHCCVLWNQPAAATLLLDHGADIELEDPDRQTTPLRYAIVYAKPEMIRLLLSRGANAGPRGESGGSAYQLAVDAANGSLEEYEELPTREEYAGIVRLLEELGHG